MHREESLPEAVKVACNECPWRRDSTPGHLGPNSPQVWAEMIHSDTAIACHKTIFDVDETGSGSWSHPRMRQCWGSAVMRRNIAKRPRDPQVAVAEERDTERFFSWTDEFINHHEGRGNA